MALWWRAAVFVWACLAAVPLTAASQNPGTEAGSGPRLIMSEAERDLGQLDPRDTHPTIDIPIRNAGHASLEIRRIRSSCTCISANVASSSVPPGGETTLRLRLLQVPLVSYFAEEVFIYSNDGARPLTKFRLSGSAKNELKLIPPAVGLGAMYRGDVSKTVAKIQVLSFDGGPLPQLRVVPSDPAIQAKARPLGDGSYEVETTFASTIPTGKFNGTLRLESGDPARVLGEIPVLAVILGELDPYGRRIDFGFIPEGQPAAVTFRLERRGTREIHVLNADSQLPVPSKVEVTPEGNDFKLVLRIGPAPALTRLLGHVELHTDNPDEPLIRIPVAGGVLSKAPFQQAEGDGGEERLLAIVKDALARGDRIPEDRFFSDVLGGIADGRASALLLRAAADEDMSVRMRSVQLLARFKTPEVLDRLRLLTTDDPEEFVRQDAVLAYAEAAGKAAIPTLLLALEDDDPWTREYAATYLGKLGDDTVIPALRAAVKDPDPEAAEAVRNALTSLQGRRK